MKVNLTVFLCISKTTSPPNYPIPFQTPVICQNKQCNIKMERGNRRKQKKENLKVVFFLTTVTYSKLYISGCFHSTHMYLTETNVSQSNNYPYRGRHTFIFSILFYPILFNRAFDTLVSSMNHEGLKKTLP